MAREIQNGFTVQVSSIVKLLAIAGLLAFLWLVRGVLALLCIAVFFAGLMHPAVRWGERHRIPKGVVVIIIYLGLLGLLATSFALLIPVLVQQSGSLVKSIGASASALTETVNRVHAFSDQYGLGGNVSASILSLQSQISGGMNDVFSSLTGVFGGVVDFIIVLVMAFYMVVQEKQARRLFHDFVPEAYQDMVARTLESVEIKMGWWLSA